MPYEAPIASVVVVTRNRADRLAAALASLRGQTLDRDAFEVVVVDDASTDATPQVISAEAARDDLAVRCLRLDAPAGAAVARNDGWRAAGGPLVAFMDDDCVASPEWLQAGVAAWGERPDRFVQGATLPIAEEWDEMGPWSYTYDIRALTHEFPTCNIFYPRQLIERLGGFDVEAFNGWGEDTDLAWRAQAAGAEPVFAEDALVRHAIVRIGPRQFLRRTFSMGDAVWLLARHAPLRRARLEHRVFWNLWHYWVIGLWIALLLPWRRSLWPVKLWLAMSWIRFRLPHPRHQRPSLFTLLWFLLADTAEVVGVVRGALRYRTFVI